MSEATQIRLMAMAATVCLALLALMFPSAREVLHLDDPKLATARFDGFGGAEPWGRWTVGDVARVRFDRPLPARFTLEITGLRAFGPNLDAPVRVSLPGGSASDLVVHADTTSAQVRIENPWRSSIIEWHIPHPTSPLDLGQSVDARKLGLAMTKLEIVP